MTLIRRLYNKEPLLGLILTFALALLIEAILRMIFGGAPVPFAAPNHVSTFSKPNFDAGVELTVNGAEVLAGVGAPPPATVTRFTYVPGVTVGATFTRTPRKATLVGTYPFASL